MQYKNVLVTGGAGFIGSHFVRFLIGKYPKVNVVNVDLLTYCGNLENVKDVARNPRYKFYKADIGDFKAMSAILKKHKVDAVVNFAAESNNNKAVLSPIDFAKTNALGMAVLLEAVRQRSSQTGKLIRFHHISCYDTKTRAFTKDGLKLFHEIKKGDLVLTLNIDRNEMEWKPVERVIVQDYNGKMIKIKTQRVDFLVTPNHRMLVQNEKSKKLVYKEAQQIKNEAINKLPAYYKWTGEIKEMPENKENLKELMYILGIFIGDGCICYQEKKVLSKSGLVKIEYMGRSRNGLGQFTPIGRVGNNGFTISKSWRVFLDIPQKDSCRKRCEDSLSKLGIKWHSHYRDNNFSRIYFTSEKFFKIFSECGKYAKNKEIPKWALNMPADLLSHLWEGLLDSDGHKRRIFFTSSQKLACQFMELCIKLNLSPNLGTRYSKSMIGDRKVEGLGYYVTCPGEDWRSIRKASIEETEYRNKVWCLQIKDNKNFLVERNGKTAFCGNTCEVYGQLPLNSRSSFTEKSHLDPRTPYNASKAAAEHIVRSYWHTFKLPVTISNCSNNYGSHQFPENIIPVFTIKALLNQKLPLFASKNNKREWTHVTDHCNGIDLVLNRGVIGETYNIGTGFEQSILQIADSVLKILSRPTNLKKLVPDRPGHDTRYLLDSSKIRKELSWKPKVKWEDGLKETVEWYKNNSGWWKPLLKKSNAWH